VDPRPEIETDRKTGVRQSEPYFTGGILWISDHFCPFSSISTIFRARFSHWDPFFKSQIRYTRAENPRLMYDPSRIRFAVYTRPVFSVPKKHWKSRGESPPWILDLKSKLIAATTPCRSWCDTGPEERHPKSTLNYAHIPRSGTANHTCE
jgi:hypothetical protein